MGNKKQFDFYVGILKQLAEIRDSLESSSIEDIESKLDSAIKGIEWRLKLIRIADKKKKDGGRITVDEYETSDLADDSDDEKKIRQANARALSKKT